MQPIVIDAVIEDAEGAALTAACDLLRECLGAALGRQPVTEIHWHGSAAAIVDPGTVVILSLLRDTKTDEPLERTAARWGADLDRLTQQSAPVFIATVFRHVAGARGLPLASPQQRILNRIRRLNLLAAELSHDTGANVIDIDRALAHLGSRALGAGHRLAGRAAAETAGHTMAWSLLSCGLDDWASAEVLERAKKNIGDLQEIAPLIRRRLELSA